MKCSEFLDEALSYDLCPHNFKKIYNEFNVFQAASLSTLLEFHRVCELNDINYQVAYGSLLGVIRDGGQIPWDYDIDVILPFEDKARLIQALEMDLDPRFYFYCPENNKKCRHVIMRLAPKEYRTEALHVDVFFFIGTPEADDERKNFELRIKSLADKRYGKLVKTREEAAGSFRRYINLIIRRKLPNVFASLNSIDYEYSKLCNKYSSRSSSVCVSADSYADWCEYPSDLLWDTQLYKSDFGEIRIPVHYKELLELIYGEYLSIPPIENRIQEVIHHHHRIKYFNSL